MATYSFGEDKEEDSNVQNGVSLWLSLSGSQAPLFKGFWVCEFASRLRIVSEEMI